MASKSPPLPEGMPCWDVELEDEGRRVVRVVTVRDAAKLAGVTKPTMERWVAEGKVTIGYTPDRAVRVLIESLWAAIPSEVQGAKP